MSSPLAALLCLLAAGASVNGQAISRLFTQQLDHFNSSDTRTFHQRYFLANPINTSMTGPLLFYVGPESETGAWAVNIRTFVQASWAQELDGLLIAAEHRYFGASLPFGNASFTAANMKWLTVEQTLRDYVTIIESVVSAFPRRPPVVVFGGSYGGLLSAALRLHYPGFINASIASAAPLYELGEVDNSTWFNLLSETYSGMGGCGTRVASEFAAIYDNRFNRTAWAPLQAALGLCTPVSSIVDVYLLLFYAKHAFSISAQFSYSHAGPPTGVANSLSVVCETAPSDLRPFPLMFVAMNLTYNGSYAAPCFSFRPPTVDTTGSATSARNRGDFVADVEASLMSLLSVQASAYARATTARQAVGAPLTIETVPWSYLCCTQIVMPVSGTGLFSVPDNYNFTAQAQYCNKQFGVTPDPSWHRQFLLWPLQRASNIVFVNGGYDPVRGYSPTRDSQPALPAVNVPDMGHTFDLFAANESDPEAVTAARARVRNITVHWIGL